ncbi:hypothetical protein V2J09_017882 [Rumex salicifolius]
MLRFAITRVSSAAAAGRISRFAPPRLGAVSSPFRSYQTSDPRDVNPVALQMINYAVGLARSLKSDESYAQALLTLEQCLTSQSQEGQDDAIENSKGMVLLAVSTLLSERGNTDDAIQTLLRIQDLPSCSLGIRVAAMEALVGLNLELGLDDTSSVLADNGLNLFHKECQRISDESGYEVLNSRAKAIKGLVELVHNNLDSAKTLFEGCKDESCIGNAALSYGELLHAKRDFTTAKKLYQRVITGLAEKKDYSDSVSVAACNMASEEVLLAATCALGQLESHMGNFENADVILTKALKQAEEHFGTYHPKVGTVLTCIALMYRQKAISEYSSSLLIQEGLYRKAMDLLKAPPLEKDGPDLARSSETVDKRDIVVLARGGYAEALCVQEMRKPEGERLKNWASNAWRNRRLSLAEALDISEPASKVPVIDTRICRVL